MGTIGIGGVTYEVYGSKTLADAYFKAAVHGAAWLAAEGSVRNQAIVTAMRVFERTSWEGDPTEPIDKTQPQPADTQPLAWPRTGLTDREEVAVPDDVIPQDILDGSYEYAFALIGDATLQQTSPTGSNLKSEKATQRVEGAITVSTERGYFKSTLGALPPFPTIVWDYVGQWMSGQGIGPLVAASGIDEVSAFADGAGDFGVTGRGF